MNNNLKTEKIILGIDPGTNILGYGLIKSIDKEVSHINYGILKLGKYSDHIIKIRKICEKINTLIEEYTPNEIAIEAPFYGVNVQSMLKLGKVQGAVIALAVQKDIPIIEYTPKKIKVAITGNGNASKEQVAKMVEIHLNIDKIELDFDASDALAIAITHALQKNSKKNKNASWKEFLKENQDKLIT
ncbi:MAG: crossover junction endodeoxyribonuclease RuvC [Bacteroidetes bacterium]|nr:crossover junction endodeoxyribonuclease RuvC [Bacteroidota bacterium]